MLKPVWEEAAKATKNEFPEEGKVALAGVDCESEGTLGTDLYLCQFTFEGYLHIKLSYQMNLHFGQVVAKIFCI